MNKRDTILIVDDIEVNRVILRGIFEGEYQLLEAENGGQAVSMLEQYHSSIAVVLLDLVMPVKDGYQVMQELERLSLLSEFPVIVITAEDSVENEVKVFDLGAADIIMKPFEPYVVKRRVQNAVELNLRRLNQQELIDEQAAKLRESNSIMVDALSSIIEFRSVETGQHIQRIRLFTQELLKDVAQCYPEYGLDERDIGIIVSASSLHDIGKIAIPDSILNKPGRLTAEEFEVMKTHATKGCEMLINLDRMSDQEYLRYAYNICRYHHERWDGQGYPDHLKGDSIPICAQVVGVADCYDALTTDRVYKKAISSELAFNMILNGECGHFSPKLLESLKHVRDIFSSLAQEYADGRPPHSGNARPAPPILHQEAAPDTLQLGQMKYFTLLRYADSTVMELDFDSGLYHVVYLSSGDFELLRTGGSFDEVIRRFVNGVVHPDDRESALSVLSSDLQVFFLEGLMQRSLRYRVLDRSTQAYRWCQTDLLRVDTGNPNHHRAMLVWRFLPAESHAPGAEESSLAHLGRDAVLRDLLGSLHTCRNDQWLTLTQMNSGLKNQLGYTDEELQTQFHNHYLDLILPEDQTEVLGQIKTQLAAGNAAELEYRLTAKDGRVIWVLEKCHQVTDADGAQYIVGLLLDVTRYHRDQDKSRLSLERYRTFLERSGDLIFEWDIRRDQMSYSDNWKKKLGYPPIAQQASVLIPQSVHVHPDDQPRFSGLIRSIAGGSPFSELEFRLSDFKGQYRWFKVRIVTQLDRLGQPLRAVGMLTDIDKEKQVSQILKDEAERDGLTRLYNKSSGRRLVERCLEQETATGLSAMLILDVDDFKHINDTFGHMFGDVVLQELASELRRLFRPQDILSRIGGDEFMIFLHGVPNQQTIISRAASVIDAVHALFHSDEIQYTPSCSIGAAFFPQDGRDYETLFQHCDQALYQAKFQGKNTYALYDQASAAGQLDRLPTTASTSIESSDAPERVMSGLVDRIFHTLYESDNLRQAIASILELLGRQFNVSRVYIFEDIENGLYCKNTFEWCNEGISPQIDRLQHVDYDDVGGRQNYRKLFNEQGVFYCPNILHLPRKHYDFLAAQDIISILHCEIRGSGGIGGFVGFDDCRLRRVWTAEQINALSFIAKLLSIFLHRRQAQEQAVIMAQNLRSILNHQDAWIYVVEPGTFNLQYINAKTRQLAPDAVEGMTCHGAFFNRKSPCEFCPLLRDAQHRKIPLEVYNPRLKVWSSVSVSSIQWGERTSYLLTCKDVTHTRPDRPQEAIAHPTPSALSDAPD